MKIFPAIDLLNKQVVRLSQGDYDKKTIYTENALSVVEEFIKAGADSLHIVDLDGAKTGEASNGEIIKLICKKPIFVELGGGIRKEEDIIRVLGMGVKRCILGTVAVKNPYFVENMANKYGEAIAVGVDAINNKVAINGWKCITSANSVDFCVDMRNRGVKTIIYTDISKDGMLNGTNLDIYKELSKIEGLNIIASGGVSFEHEIEKLRDMNIYGAILGKALYENKLSLKNALAIAGGKNIC